VALGLLLFPLLFHKGTNDTAGEILTVSRVTALLSIWKADLQKGISVRAALGKSLPAG